MKQTRYFSSRILLSVAVLHLSLVAGGCTAIREANTSEPAQAEAEAAPAAVQIDEAYLRELQEKPPRDLTAEEIAYLEMAAQKAIQEEQASELGWVRGILAADLLATVLLGGYLITLIE